MVEQQSLETLTGTSEHRILSPYIDTLEICVNHLLPLNELRLIEPAVNPIEEFRKRGLLDEGVAVEDSDIPGSDRLSRLDEKAYRKYLEDQEQLICTGHDIACLSQAMSRLVNCKRTNITNVMRP
ncbi:hypothetical protein BKA56DRAFT_624280 [Ilyonectria sp. MPI-CAGE-AT-0026]|nr:hypothetical protein BKA56DRAFT_624280 [Ilyonectria sp. MPI-CAGE-AT-0026]